MSIANSGLYGEPFERLEAEKRLAAPADWRLPTAAEKEALRSDRVLPDLADDLIAAADVHDEAWILLERDWFGFPDPPRFEFIAYRPDGHRVCQAGLDHLPSSWLMPTGVPFKFSEEK